MVRVRGLWARWRVGNCVAVFCRRCLLHSRRPYFLPVIGMAFLLLSIASLQSRTGMENIVSYGWRDGMAPLTRLLSESNTVDDQPQMLHVLKEATPATLFDNITSNLTVNLSQMEAMLRDMQKRIKRLGFRIKTKPGKANDAQYRYRDLAAMQAERQDRIRHVCDVVRRQAQNKERSPAEIVYHEGWYGPQFRYKVMEVYRPQNFFFCPVLKVGSTFFRRLFYALSHGKEISSPYDIPIKTALVASRGNLDEVFHDAPGRRPPQGPSRRPGPAGNKPHGSQPLGQLARHSLRPRPVVDKRSTSTRLAGSRTSTLLADDPVKRAEAEKRVADFLTHAGKAMFTREPYSKLLSGYVDKLFAPNPYFWKAVGRHIIKEFRPNASALSLTCGHDVTFPEFIKYVIKSESSNEQHRDTHFVPTYDQCRPCDYHYDLIGKMETFSQDASLVVAQLGFNLSQSTLKEWSRESEFDAIEDSIKSPYGWKRDVSKCMSWEKAHRRIWRKLQIRGLLDKKEALPVDFKLYTTSSAQFIPLVKRSWERFRTNSTKSKQKKEALSSAYSLVPREDLELLREYFLLDFDLFGYDSYPAGIFEAKNTWDVFNLQH